jgi:hypothetical protein
MKRRPDQGAEPPELSWWTDKEQGKDQERQKVGEVLASKFEPDPRVVAGAARARAVLPNIPTRE